MRDSRRMKNCYLTGVFKGRRQKNIVCCFRIRLRRREFLGISMSFLVVIITHDEVWKTRMRRVQTILLTNTSFCFVCLLLQVLCLNIEATTARSKPFYRVYRKKYWNFLELKSFFLSKIEFWHNRKITLEQTCVFFVLYQRVIVSRVGLGTVSKMIW